MPGQLPRAGRFRPDATQARRLQPARGAEFPRDIADKYFPEFGKNPEFKIHSLGGYRGLGAWFGVRISGVTAQGNRLFIQSTTHLYCIGPAVRGTPQDDPKVVATIRCAAKAEDLASHLAGPSAQYRYEAALRLAKMPGNRGQSPFAGTAQRVLRTNGDCLFPVAEPLKRLVVEDSYEEIRAAAVLALNAGDPTANPGSKALLAEFAAAAEMIAAKQFDPAGRQRYEVAERTVYALGASAEPILAAEFPKAQPAVQVCLLGAADFCNIRNETILLQALAWLDSTARRKLPGGLNRCAGEWSVDYVGERCPTDPRCLPALVKSWKGQGDFV